MLKKSASFFVLMIIILSSCQEKKVTMAQVSGKYTGIDKPLTLLVRDQGSELNFSIPIYIDTVTTSADGLFSFTVDAPTPKELLLEAKSPDGNGKIYQSIFVEAGDSVYYESDGKYRSPLKNLRGKGSNKLSVMDSAGGFINGMGFFEIIAKKDSALVLGDFHARLKKYDTYLDSITPLFSTAFANYLQASKLQETAYFLQILPSYLNAYGYASFEVDSVEREKAYQALASFSAEGYKNSNFADQLYQLLMTNLPKTDSVSKRIESYMGQVDSLHLPEEGRQLMIGRGILSFLRRGKVKEIEPTLRSFHAQYPSSVYNKTLDEQFEDWNALSAGKPARDFTATHADGKSFKLSDLKGKVVYIDIWATWCGPCRAEFPYTKDIKKHYQKNKDIVFLYVSVDEDKESWLKYLKDNPDFEGVQVNDPGNFDSAIAKAYKVSGIPRYMIIDRGGKIFSTDANRPSGGEKLIAQLDQALGQ
jgi:thiol-disulfide isomerase/thioredoxin